MENKWNYSSGGCFRFYFSIYRNGLLKKCILFKMNIFISPSLNDFLRISQTGDFASSEDLSQTGVILLNLINNISGGGGTGAVNLSGYITTGSADGRYYPLVSNPSGYANLTGLTNLSGYFNQLILDQSGYNQNSYLPTVNSNGVSYTPNVILFSGQDTSLPSLWLYPSALESFSALDDSVRYWNTFDLNEGKIFTGLADELSSIEVFDFKSKILYGPWKVSDVISGSSREDKNSITNRYYVDNVSGILRDAINAVSGSSASPSNQRGQSLEILSVFSGAGSRSVVRPSGSEYHTVFASALTGSAPYTGIISLNINNSPLAADKITLSLALPSSSNPTIEVRQESSTGNLLLTITNPAAASDVVVSDFTWSSTDWVLTSPIFTPTNLLPISTTTPAVDDFVTLVGSNGVRKILATNLGVSGGNYTDEEAQNAISYIISGTNTVDLVYTSGANPQLKADARSQMSISSDTGGLRLIGDLNSPGNNKLYGTNESGVRGWYNQPVGTGNGASTTQSNEFFAGYISNPANKNYKIVVKVPHGGTITEVNTVSETGTCSLVGIINSTTLSGLANDVSATRQSQNHTSGNIFVASDDILLGVSSVASCTGLSFSIKYTRTLD